MAGARAVDKAIAARSRLQRWWWWWWQAIALGGWARRQLLACGLGLGGRQTAQRRRFQGPRAASRPGQGPAGVVIKIPLSRNLSSLRCQGRVRGPLR